MRVNGMLNATSSAGCDVDQAIYQEGRGVKKGMAKRLEFCEGNPYTFCLTFDYTDLDWLYLYPRFLQPFDGSLDVCGRAAQLKAHDTNLIGNAGLADIGHHWKFLGQLPNDGTGDFLGRIHQP